MKTEIHIGFLCVCVFYFVLFLFYKTYKNYQENKAYNTKFIVAIFQLTQFYVTKVL